MEKRLTKKCDEHLSNFKDKIKLWFEENNAQVEGDQTTNDFLNFIYDFNGLTLNKEDFLKRKRIKSMVPQYERCCANRANGEQCTRRHGLGANFCGTHQKGTPHGVINMEVNTAQEYTKIELSIKEIKGIHYYIDDDKNVYKPEDVLSNKINPAIIAYYVVDKEGNYSIPSFKT